MTNSLNYETKSPNYGKQRNSIILSHNDEIKKLKFCKNHSSPIKLN